MSNIINFFDKKKQKVDAESPKEEMLKVLESVKQLIDEDKLTGLAAVATGPDGKTFSVLAGEFDIIHIVGGLETVKHLLISSDTGEEY
jgi:hypothetical protein